MGQRKPSSRTVAGPMHFCRPRLLLVKGFLKDENLEPLLIQMRSQVTVPALISGEVHYPLSFGNILGGAMQGCRSRFFRTDGQTIAQCRCAPGN